jgi:hypothetical protein
VQQNCEVAEVQQNGEEGLVKGMEKLDFWVNVMK